MEMERIMKVKREYIVKCDGKHVDAYTNIDDAMTHIETIKRDDLSFRAYRWARANQHCDTGFADYIKETIDNTIYLIEVRDTRLH